MPDNLKLKVKHFITFKIASRTLMGIGNLVAPFSKVGNTAVLSPAEFDWVKLRKITGDNTIRTHNCNEQTE